MQAAEFFSGMGLMRSGLERTGIKTTFANDIDRTKAALYRENWGNAELHVGDIRELAGGDIPDVDLATASFPCVDLSLAGHRQGLNGSQSGLIRDFLRILDEMGKRAPQTILIENVPGLLTANGGVDWKFIVSSLRKLDYFTSHLIVDASAFVPQSRSRVFIVGHQAEFQLPDPPAPRNDLRLADVADDVADWWSPRRLGRFLLSLSDLQAKRVANYQNRDELGYFGAFRRTRHGTAVWEVRADEKAGALRTTRGGSAKQAIVRAGQGNLAVRWMTVKEYARLQGAEDLNYEAVTPGQAMFALGDAVCVPVIEWISEKCLKPLMGP